MCICLCVRVHTRMTPRVYEYELVRFFLFFFNSFFLCFGFCMAGNSLSTCILSSVFLMRVKTSKETRILQQPTAANSSRSARPHSRRQAGRSATVVFNKTAASWRGHLCDLTLSFLDDHPPQNRLGQVEPRVLHVCLDDFCKRWPQLQVRGE